ncbi:hypothetical protein F183_A39090 [Bryobacterales bacterium F-183]|nr:hypothetical protein F183_A39090 [Bryobacterales bacterium F-183]
MDILQQLGTALGLGFLSGIRLYLTTLLIGAAIRLEWLQLSDSYSGLNILADWRVLAFSGVACLIEFIADKVPWVDSAWDSAHTFIRPVGAALLASGAFAHTEPAIKAMLMILCGGIALTGHSAKSATRLAVNQSPEPFSNWALSLAGDALVPVATWFTFQYPIAMLTIVSVFAIIVWWGSPKIFRLMRVETTALTSAISRWLSLNSELPPSVSVLASLPAMSPEAKAHLRAIPLPLLDALKKKGYTTAGYGIHCAAVAGSRSIRSSIGYLTWTLAEGKPVFITRRWFCYRAVELPLGSMTEAIWDRNVIVDTLKLGGEGKGYRFSVFRPSTTSDLPTRSAATTTAG